MGAKICASAGWCKGEAVILGEMPVKGGGGAVKAEGVGGEWGKLKKFCYLIAKIFGR
jgi:hypothetical protein